MWVWVSVWWGGGGGGGGADGVLHVNVCPVTCARASN